jgi:hypothetical protein
MLLFSYTSSHPEYIQVIREAIMAKDKPIWSGKRIMERWDSSPTELGSFIYQGLRAFRMEGGAFHQIRPEELNKFDSDSMTDLLFTPNDVQTFENESELAETLKERVAALAEAEAHELTDLKKQKAKWNSSILAAVKAGIFCAESGGEIIRKDLEALIYKIDKDIPNQTINEIWEALPDKYRKGSGRPKKARAK